MAGAIVLSALKKLADFGAKKVGELYDVHKEIEPMQRNLEMFQAFLRDSDSKQHKNESEKVWVKQVNNLAIRIEMAIDKFLVEIEKNRSRDPGIASNIQRAMEEPNKLIDLSREFKEIREEMKRIFEFRTQMEIVNLGNGSEELPQLPSNIRPTKPIHVDDSEVIGFDSDKCKIISHLKDENILRRTVLSIVGVGGLGKTTLAQKVYKSAELNAEFPCRAWLSISQKFDANKLYREILSSVEKTVNEYNLIISDEEVLEKLVNILSRERYLIILDDVWTIDLWEQLKIAFPDTKNASRVIITTRNLDVASAADRNTEPHNLDYLNEDESITLLFRKALQQDIQVGRYSSPLVEIAKKLTEKCGRLPLALVVLGSMLSTKPDTCIAWTKVYDTLDWHDDQGKKCTQALRMSYQELCYEQKQRFLYFAAFPEDHIISAQQITKLWIAEGLIPVDGAGTMEDRAENCLEDLLKRSLIQVIRKSWNGSCKYCSMHDLLRDLAIHEAEETNFFTVLSKHKEGSQLATEEIYRLALHYHNPTSYGMHSTYIHSLLCFGGSVPNYQLFPQLRVLVLEDIDFQGIEVGKNWLEGLVHMKYLGFRRCKNMKEVGENISFSTMKNLETFDCELSNIYSNMNLSLWEVPTLRHVITGYSQPFCPLKWDNLKNLQTLECMLPENIPELESNVNLRTLKVYLGQQTVKNWNVLLALLSRAEHLVTLAISFDTLSEELFQTARLRELPCYETIQCLNICGQWASAIIPPLETFPKNLIKLQMEESSLVEDPMPILERLQFLRILHLFDMRILEDNGKKITCSAGGFPSLREMIIDLELFEWEIEEGAMPVLSKLTIETWHGLSFPELQNVPTLRSLIVDEFLVDIEPKLQSEYKYKIEHIPSVSFLHPVRGYCYCDFRDDAYGDYDDDEEGDYSDYNDGDYGDYSDYDDDNCGDYDVDDGGGGDDGDGDYDNDDDGGGDYDNDDDGDYDDDDDDGDGDGDYDYDDDDYGEKEDDDDSDGGGDEDGDGDGDGDGGGNIVVAKNGKVGDYMDVDF